MLGGNTDNHVLPVFLEENRFQYQTNAQNNWLQLFGNMPGGCTVDPVNYIGNKQNDISLFRLNKQGKESEDLSTRQQKFQISLNYNVCQDEVDRSVSIPNKIPVSTGLRLSNDDDERNSSVTSASGRRTSSEGSERFEAKANVIFLTTIEKGINKKLREKELELENMNRKNKVLVDRIKQVATEAQNWRCRARYNHSTVNVLQTNLQQAISQGIDQGGKEGFGDSEVDDAASYMDPNNYLGLATKDKESPYPED